VTTTTADTSSLKEAATLARLPEGKVRREVEHRVIEPETVWIGRAPRRIFRDRDVHYLTFIACLREGVELSRSIRSRVYREFSSGSYGPSSAVARAGLGKGDDPEQPNVVTFNHGAAVEAAARRIELYRRGMERVTSNGAVLGGEPVERIREDYPHLNEEDVEFAALFAQATPLLGRPRTLDATS
jgi:hypothetical protein